MFGYTQSTQHTRMFGSAYVCVYAMTWMVRSVSYGTAWGCWHRTYNRAMGRDVYSLCLFLLIGSNRDVVVVGRDVYAFKGFGRADHYRWAE